MQDELLQTNPQLFEAQTLQSNTSFYIMQPFVMVVAQNPRYLFYKKIWVGYRTISHHRPGTQADHSPADFDSSDEFHGESCSPCVWSGPTGPTRPNHQPFVVRNGRRRLRRTVSVIIEDSWRVCVLLLHEFCGFFVCVCLFDLTRCVTGCRLKKV